MSAGAILLSEADDTDRKMLGYVLAHEGFAVYEAESAEQTIQVAQRDPIGLIILGLDLWQTPQMDTLSVLKRNPKTSRIPILLFGQPQSREQVQKALQTALARANVTGVEILEGARKFGAEIAMEMVSLFPGSASQVYKKKPIEALIYYAPRGKFLDLCKTYFEVRCQSMVVLTQIGSPIDIEALMVANLLHTPQAPEQIEMLNAIKTAGMFEGRKGLILLPTEPDPEHRKIVPSDWRLVTTPTRPKRWLGWLAGGS